MMRPVPIDDLGPHEIVSAAPSRRALIATAGGLAASAAAFYLGTKLGRTPQPAFRRLTFRRGIVTLGLFAPNSRDIVYSASWEGAPSRIFSTLPGSVESRALDIPPARLVSISRQGELAVILNTGSTLARVPLAGGSPREILRNVIWADWSPDGSSFLIVRQAGSKQRIEFPIGKVLYETENQIPMARISPDGRRIAFYENSPGGTFNVNLNVIDRGGAPRTLVEHWHSADGLVWSPSGKEIWFSSTNDSTAPSIRAVDLAGKIRPILKITQAAVVSDVLRDGRVLFTGRGSHTAMMCQPPGETGERDLSWLDYSLATGISGDGSTILFSETREAAVASGRPSLAYMRKTDGSPAVLLGPGTPLNLSPDGQWAAILISTSPRQLLIVPAGAGEQRVLKADRFTYADARWFPDGKRLLVWGNEDARLRRHYVQDASGGSLRAITPEGAAQEAAIAPDGLDVAAHSGPGVFLFPVEGGQPEPVRGSGADTRPVAWSDDGRSLYLRRGSVVELVDWKTGKGEVWKDLMPADPAGVVLISRLSITPDGRAYVYSYERDQSELYLAEGL